MREYILKTVGAVILYAMGEMLLPEGNIKKYSCVVLSLLVALEFLSPVGISDDFKAEIFENTDVSVTDTFTGDVRAEYERRLEDMIYENTGVNARVITDGEFGIVSVTLPAGSGDDAIIYITEKLGVHRSDIQTG